MSTYRSLADTWGESIDFARLLARLARAELAGQAGKAGRGSAFGVAAVLALFVAIVFLLLGAVEWLIANGFAAHLAFFLVGGGVLAIGLLMGVAAYLSIKDVTLRPTRTLEQIRRFSAATSQGRSDERES
jgi:hypothetical protein